ncbi:HotDog domain-containing protein [Aspergillus granulosus]|uniref:HotDog domain-containing protein n=1 Tax=Aspergillus granulosus TaxID=176169 RepID=A0ABR4H6V5_9EURO
MTVMPIIKYTRVQGYLDFINRVPTPPSDVASFASKLCAAPYLNPSSTYRAVPFYLQEDWLRRATDALTTERNPTTHPDEPDMVVFLHLESDVNGLTDTAHGGVLAAILDEVIATSVIGYKTVLGGETILYTAYLNLTYRALVETPSTVLIKAWLTKREGRKWFTEAQLVGEDGRVRTEASGMWVAAKGNL